MAFGIRHLLAAGALAALMVMPGAGVRAQSAIEFWIQQQRHWAPRYDERWGDGWPRGRQGYYGPDITVKSPQYRSYVPDMPKPISLAKVCQFKVASNTAAEPAPAPVTAEPSFAAACAAEPALTLRVLPQVGAALNDYYSSHPKFLWVDNDTVNDEARAVMAALALSDRYGLNSANYHVALPATGSADDKAAQMKTMMRLELTLSAKVLTYVLDATRGRVDPNRMSEYYDLPRKHVDLVAALDQIAKSNDVVSYLDSRNPDNPQFRALVAALAKARAVAPEPPIIIPAGTFIRPSENDPALPQVIAAIKQSGSAALKEKYADTLSAYDGGETYGRDLVALVRAFQREKGLNSDGVIGRNTTQAMKPSTPADRVEKLKLAMERLRWLPRQFGKRYVLLNEPAYQVTFVRGDDKPLTMRAIVGKPTHQTYFFADIIKEVEYNPYWGVPRSIVINEMLPHLYNDPSYLDRMGYEITDARGRQISSADVDWDGYARKRISVDVRQPPGRGNALGQLKIEFPNKHAIYMHDTPEKQLFKNQRLAFSHGCVRLEHPRVMAAALLGKPVSYVDEQIATGENHNEPVGGNIPVYLTYFTAWPDNDGAIRYYADVYGRDGQLAKALAKTEAVRKAATAGPTEDRLAPPAHRPG